MILNEFLKISNPELFECTLPECTGLEYNENNKEICIYFEVGFTETRNEIIMNSISKSFRIKLECIVEMNGYIIDHYFVYQDEYLAVLLKPNYAYEANEVKTIYHVCPKSVYENHIIKTGLIPKWNNKHKTLYAPRICFSDVYPATNEEYKKYIEAYNPTYKDKKEYVLLRINLPEFHNYHFYRDFEYPTNGLMFFTYDTINPKYIHKVKEITIL